MGPAILHILAFCGYSASLGLLTWGWKKQTGASPRWQSGLLYAAFGFHTVSIVLRGLALGQSPLFSLADGLSFFAWATVLGCVVLRIGYRSEALQRVVPALVVVLMGLSLIAGIVSGGATVRMPGPSAPVHAGMYLLGYAAFAMAFLSAGIYLLLERRLKRKEPSALSQPLGSLAVMERINHASLVVGVLCLTTGIAMGISMLQDLGRPVLAAMGQDPKILLALFTWVLYVGLLVGRWTHRLVGRKAAYLSIAGFAMVFVSFLGVQHMAKGF